MEKVYIDLVEKAIEAQKNSYSPYSNYAVGAALLTVDEKIFLGANIENAAYGPCNCGERTAMFSAIANGCREWKAIAIVGGDLSEFTYPCGVCRQVMVEFNPQLEVVLGKKTGNKIEYKIEKAKDLLPNFFGPKSIKGYSF